MNPFQIEDLLRYQQVKYFFYSFRSKNDIFIFFSVDNPATSHQRLAIDINSTKLNVMPKVKPPREVSLRVKFIRLGEVSFIINLYLFIFIYH